MRKLKLIMLCLLSIQAYAQEKTFVKEYTYHASEADSKVSCRTLVTGQLRTSLLNEIGTYVESERLLKTDEMGGKYDQSFVENVATLTAGITKFEVVDETWNGETYWMKAAITIDEKSLEESLRQLIADRQKTKELTDLNNQLKAANEQLLKLSSELKAAKDKELRASLAGRYNVEIGKLSSSNFIHSALGKSHNGDYQGAIKDYTNAIGLDPGNITAYYLRAATKMKLDDWSGAIADCNSSIDILPSAMGYFLRGAAKERSGDISGASQDYDKAVALDPSFTEAYYNRGAMKLKLKDYTGAIADCNKVLMTDAKDASAWHNRATAKLHLGDYPGSIRDYDEAIVLDPNGSIAYYMRGQAYFKEGNKGAACSDWNTAGGLGNQEAVAYIKSFCK